MSSADVGQFALPDAVALDRVEQAVDVAELVIEQRTDDALGQIEPHVAQLLASLVPRLLLVGLRCSAAHLIVMPPYPWRANVTTFSK